jgi:glyoxylase-like metal-dependent hydrolase (beta-lactamase superfamily II)
VRHAGADERTGEQVLVGDDQDASHVQADRLEARRVEGLEARFVLHAPIFPISAGGFDHPSDRPATAPSSLGGFAAEIYTSGCSLAGVSAEDRLYFRQLLAGRDVAPTDPIARQMVNFVYLVGDRETGEAIVVDPAYDVRGVLDVAAADGMRVVGALATHYHPDHVGGDMMGYQISGVRELLMLEPVPIHVQSEEATWVERVTGVGDSDLVRHDSGDVVSAGSVDIELIHTPGHTPGSQCFLVDGRYLVSGDTLFLEGCGRTDLPGGDPAQLYESLTQKLAKVPDDAVLFPGHLYSAEPSATMGETRRLNYVFKPRSAQQWLAMFG